MAHEYWNFKYVHKSEGLQSKKKFFLTSLKISNTNWDAKKTFLYTIHIWRQQKPPHKENIPITSISQHTE